MDPLDFAIYRFLSPDGEARLWAGRRVIDPTIPAREVAERVGISENGVRTRLRGLAERGFLRGKALTPNPSLFDVKVFVTELPVRGASEAERVFQDLALVEGVIFARDTMDEGDRHLRIYFVSDAETMTSRRAALLRRLSPRGEIRPPEPYWIPSCERELSPLDWRLLDALARNPEATLAETARRVRISLKTATKRYRQLIDSHACWWTHGPDSEEFPLALIRVDVKDVAHRAPIALAIEREAMSWMPVAGNGLGVPPGGGATIVAGLVPADAPTVLERMVKKLVILPGVLEIRRTFALGSKTYPSWYADRVAELAHGS